MELVNSILDRCIVEEQDDCLKSAEELLPYIDDAIFILQRGGQMLKDEAPRPCRVCGKGYKLLAPSRDPKDKERVVIAGNKEFMGRGYPAWAGQLSGAQKPILRVFACDACGHCEIFHFPDGLGPTAWAR
jgi:hypothetical protein